MPRTKPGAPRSDRSGVALLLIDVINAFDFPGSARLVAAATRVAPNIQKLASRARKRGVPVIYVNDNFGRWRSDFKATVAACTRAGQPGRLVSKRLTPERGDYFVLKPQHSGFYSTTLSLLLNALEVRTLILTGFAANLCVLFTANDAHMHGYHLVVPADCTASNSRALTRSALDHVRIGLSGDVTPSARIDFEALESASKKRTDKAL